MLFRKTEDRKRELSQTEREAIVDLLHLCLYADSHIALKEGDFMSDVVGVVGWDTRSSFESYEAQSIAKARAAHESTETKQVLLTSAAERLKLTKSRAFALELCEQLFASDGSTADREAALLTEVRTALA